MAGSWRHLNLKIAQNARIFSTTRQQNDSKDSWLSKLLVRKIEPTKESHSRMLSDKEVIYGLQTHNFRADSRDEYIANMKRKVDWTKAQSQLSDKLELSASWTVSVGDQDQALHLWKYTGGFEAIDNANELFAHDEV